MWATGPPNEVSPSMRKAAKTRATGSRPAPLPPPASLLPPLMETGNTPFRWH